MKLSLAFKRALETEVRRLIEQQTNPSTSDGTNRIARRRARRRRAGRAQRPSMATMLQGGRAGEQVRTYSKPNMSKGHVAVKGKYEWFIHKTGGLYRASLDKYIGKDGYRMGARREAPPHLITARLDQFGIPYKAT